jgi:hypothetical protein
VATTLWPAASAASAIERPRPTELPVMSQVSFMYLPVLISNLSRIIMLGGVARRHVVDTGGTRV